MSLAVLIWLAPFTLAFPFPFSGDSKGYSTSNLDHGINKYGGALVNYGYPMQIYRHWQAFPLGQSWNYRYGSIRQGGLDRGELLVPVLHKGVWYANYGTFPRPYRTWSNGFGSISAYRGGTLLPLPHDGPGYDNVRLPPDSPLNYGPRSGDRDGSTDSFHGLVYDTLETLNSKKLKDEQKETHNKAELNSTKESEEKEKSSEIIKLRSLSSNIHTLRSGSEPIVVHKRSVNVKKINDYDTDNGDNDGIDEVGSFKQKMKNKKGAKNYNKKGKDKNKNIKKTKKKNKKEKEEIRKHIKAIRVVGKRRGNQALYEIIN